jgi:hypothetical protein
MMRAVAFGAALLLAGSASAQDIDAEIEEALGAADAAEAAAAGEEEPPPAAEEEEELLPQIGEEDQLAVFVLQRGFYASADLGMFMTFGGTRGYSNIQPFVAVKLGFDINDMLSVQLALSNGYSSGNPLSDNDAGLGLADQEVIDYSLFGMGAEVVLALRPTPRFAIEPKVGGGLTRIHPTPHDPNDPTLFVGGFAPHAAAGVDFKYLTLLTDFTAGVSLTGYMVFSQKLIPAASAAFVVRYTF